MIKFFFLLIVNLSEKLLLLTLYLNGTFNSYVFNLLL
jgi:hypothetical protein